MNNVDHYIILNGNLVSVPENTWDIWIHGIGKPKLKLRETHLVKHGTSDIWGKAVTYFTGCDECIGSDKPLLWVSRIFDGAPMVWRYSSEDRALREHSHFVNYVKGMIAYDGIILDEIEITVDTKETS